MTTTEESAEETTAPGRRLTGRRRLLLGVAAVLLVVAVIVGVLIGTSGADGSGGDSDDRGTDAVTSGTPAAPSTAEASPTDPGAPAADPTAPPEAGPAESPVLEGGDEPPPTLPEVPLDEPVDQDGVTGSLVLIEEIDADGSGPGSIDGPAVRITVRVVNETAADVDLGNVAVNAFYGADRTPASPINDFSQSLFSGVLPPGDAAEGVYVFGVPVDARAEIRVEVTPVPGAPVMVFAGGVR